MTYTAFPNTFRRDVLAGERLIGCWSSLANPIATEILGLAGFDWLLLDAEHSPNDVRTLIPQLMALKDSPSAPVVRPPANGAALPSPQNDVRPTESACIRAQGVFDTSGPVGGRVFAESWLCSDAAPNCARREAESTSQLSPFLQRLVEADLQLFDALATERPSP